MGEWGEMGLNGERWERGQPVQPDILILFFYLGVEPGYFLMPYRIVRSLENKRHIVESGVVDKADEKFFAKCAFAYLFMSVNSRTEFPLVVIEMKGAKISCTDDTVKIVPCFRISFFRSQVVSCRISMTGVDTYANPCLVFDLVNDMGYLSELIAEI